MTDATPPVEAAPEHEPAPIDEKTTARAGRGKGRRHPAARARIAAAGIGVGAMVGLASHMDVTFSRAQTANATPLSTAASHRALVAANSGTAAKASAAVKASRPIVLTVHAVVSKVSAPSTSSYVGSGYSAPAAAPAAAPAPAAPPVATTSGSTGGG
jgi:pilus assembly protein FimV